MDAVISVIINKAKSIHGANGSSSVCWNPNATTSSGHRRIQVLTSVSLTHASIVASFAMTEYKVKKTINRHVCSPYERIPHFPASCGIGAQGKMEV